MAVYSSPSTGPLAGLTETSPTLVLGIETSCDETAAAVVSRTGDGRGTILSNVVRSQWESHRPFGGVVPEIAARAHVDCLDDLIREAMTAAGVEFGDLDAIAATAGPGLVGGLIVGLITGKVLALAHDKPLIAVNHLEAHALTAGLTDGLRPPYLLLLASGGHTQLLAVEDVGRYRRLGTTIDDALGEAFDKTAKLLGLPMPGGPAVEAAARRGNRQRFAFPRPMLGRPEAHFSFAGLKTAVRQAAMAIAPLTDTDVDDLCAAFEAAVTDAVADRVGRAMELFQDIAAAQGVTGRHLVVAGGVAANQALRGALTTLSTRRGYSFHAPPIGLCTDNGAMIAWAGAERLALGLVDGLDAPVRPRWPLDKDAAPALGAGIKGAKA
ncbi:MAG: tRNA (adenosine(37)-N6)-threonylcarbamoyltransferase complex transferase subunit TsaD [Hyphomicrobiaceae bacterium]|nr:tRNA (adenosine(37)-N6)-threonylcarbamoyltransferase complex transferase subunit TsaD [Hyphomicrobiaceae bacterium]